MSKVAEVVAKKNSSLPGPSSYDSTQAHLLGLHGAGCHMFTGKVHNNLIISRSMAHYFDLIGRLLAHPLPLQILR